jgi:hypothetical protein
LWCYFSEKSFAFRFVVSFRRRSRGHQDGDGLAGRPLPAPLKKHTTCTTNETRVTVYLWLLPIINHNIKNNKVKKVTLLRRVFVFTGIVFQYYQHQYQLLLLLLLLQ